MGVPIPQGATLETAPVPIPQGATLQPAGDGQSGLLGKAAKLATAPLVPSELFNYTPAGLVGHQIEEYADRKLPEEIASGNPWRAGIAQFMSGTIKGVRDFESSLTSPLNLALMASGTEEAGALAKVVPKLATAGRLARHAAMAYWAAKGGYDALLGRLPAESDADEAQRRLFGLASAFGIGTGELAGGAEYLRVKKMNEFLPEKMLPLKEHVDAHLAKMNEGRLRIEQMDAAERASEAIKQGEIDRAKQQLERNAVQVQQAGARAQQDFVDTIKQRKATVGRIYDKIEEKMGDTPVSTASEVVGAVRRGLESKGVAPVEARQIVGRIAGALGIRPENLAFVEGGESAGESAIEDSRDFRSPEKKAADEAELKAARSKLVSALGGGDLTFADTKNAAKIIDREFERAKNPQAASGLAEAYKEVGQLRQRAVDAAGMGDLHRAASDEYADIMAQTGDSVARKLIAHRSLQEQEISERLASFIQGSQNEAIVRRLFRWAGVDTGSLDTLRADSKRLREIIKSPASPRLVHDDAWQAAKEALSESSAESQGKVVPEVPDPQLQGLAEQKLRILRVQKLMENARSNMIYRPYESALISLGIMRLGMGNPYGVFTAGIGASRAASRMLTTDPRLVEWYANESGIEDKATALKILGAMAREGEEARR